MMTSRIPPSIGIEADRLETAINQAHLPLDQEIGVWSVYGDHGLAAAMHVLVATKEAKNPTLLRQKAAPPMDDFDRLGQQIAEAARTQAMQTGNDRANILKHLGAVLAQLSGAQPHAAPLTDQGASSLKAYDPFAAAFQGDLRSDMTPR